MKLLDLLAKDTQERVLRRHSWPVGCPIFSSWQLGTRAPGNWSYCLGQLSMARWGNLRHRKGLTSSLWLSGKLGDFLKKEGACMKRGANTNIKLQK